jgi:hypothetical protein
VAVKESAPETQASDDGWTPEWLVDIPAEVAAINGEGTVTARRNSARLVTL